MLLELVPASDMHMGLHVLMAFNLLQIKGMEMVQVLGVAHGLNGGVETDVVSSFQLVDVVFQELEGAFGETQAEVSSWGTILLWDLHFYHYRRAVVGKIQ